MSSSTFLWPPDDQQIQTWTRFRPLFFFKLLVCLCLCEDQGLWEEMWDHLIGLVVPEHSNQSINRSRYINRSRIQWQSETVLLKWFVKSIQTVKDYSYIKIMLYDDNCILYMLICLFIVLLV